MPPLQDNMAKKRSTTSISDTKSKLSNSLIGKKKHSIGNRTAKQINLKASDELRAKLDAEGQTARGSKCLS